MRRGLNIILISLIFCFIGQQMTAQYYRNQGYWKKDRFSFIAGVGASNFLGELGGRDQVGSDFIWDLETKQFRPVLTAGIRYVTSRNTAIRGQFSFAQIGGDDKLTAEPFRNHRGINFKSNIYEVSAIFEYTFYKVRPGHRYNLAGVKGQKPKAANIYGFVGIGGVHFNPKGFFNDTWYDLKPLGTEGQNIEGTEYSLYSLVIPMGIGYRWRLASNNMMVGIEIGHRITFTDYMDDVSTVYYDEDALRNQPELDEFEGVLAAYFGNPSQADDVDLNSTFTGAQRGDPEDNDAYLFVQATMQYTIGKKPYRRKRFGTKKGKRIVF